MSDNFENFMRENQEAFDQKNPNAKVWKKIEAALPGAALPRPTGKIFLAGMVLVAAMVMSVFIMFGGEKGESPSGITSKSNLPAQVKLDGYTEFVLPPVKGVNVPFQQYKVNAVEGGNIEMQTGTKISVPENAFVDEKGLPVKGEVEIKAREFHNFADVMLSGIPMKFDENGVVHDFQTAGMIDIQGAVSGKPVFIANGKSMEVNMASFAPEKDYNLYFLDPVSKKWLEIGQPENAVNEEKQKQIAALPEMPEEPLAPQASLTASSERNPPLNTNFSEDSFLEKNSPQVSLQQNAFTNELDWLVDYQEFPELKAFKDIKWKAVDEQELKNNLWIKKEMWTDMKLTEKNKARREYIIEMTGLKKKFSLVVTPALGGTDIKNAMADYKAAQKQFEIAIRKREEEVRRVYAQADLYRKFQVSNFGIYNCDRYYTPGPNAVVLTVTFDVGEELYKDGQSYSVFHSTGKSRAVITSPITKGMKIPFNLMEDNALVIMLPGNRLAVFTENDFRKINLGKDAPNNKYEFKFRIINEEIKSSADLLSALRTGKVSSPNKPSDDPS